MSFITSFKTELIYSQMAENLEFFGDFFLQSLNFYNESPETSSRKALLKANQSFLDP